jgi:hypothetical protein
MAHILTRRQFAGAAAPARGRPSSPLEPYFPSTAHQLVWRNWDLAPVECIAEALGATRANVQALACSWASAGKSWTSVSRGGCASRCCAATGTSFLWISYRSWCA